MRDVPKAIVAGGLNKLLNPSLELCRAACSRAVTTTLALRAASCLFPILLFLVSDVHPLLENGDEVCHGVSIKMLEHPELIDKEVNQCTAHGNRDVGLSSLGNTNFGLLGNSLLGLDLRCCHFGALQPFNQLDIFKDVALRRAEAVKQLVLKCFELELEAILLFHQFSLLLLQVWTFFVHHQA